jgi:RNA 3'-terminal phosphate cyclase (ATP)
MLDIDGSIGEGGGEIVRTAIAASLWHGTPLTLQRIRANRSTPGLRPQHVAALRGAVAVSDGSVEGDEVGSTTVHFEPGTVRPGTYDFDVGTAGSAVLVARTLLPALAACDAPSEIRVTGGTHVRRAPPFEYLDRVYAFLLREMGVEMEATIESYGFYPRGSGTIRVDIAPPDDWSPLQLTRRGPLESIRATSLLADLPQHIAERELTTLEDALADVLDGPALERRTRRVHASASPGNALLVDVLSEEAIELVAEIGEKGLPAETVASRCADAVEAYLAVDAPIGAHLADQIPLLMAIAGGGLCRTTHLTSHTRTQLDLVPRCFDVEFEVERLDDGTARIACKGS